MITEQIRGSHCLSSQRKMTNWPPKHLKGQRYLRKYVLHTETKVGELIESLNLEWLDFQVLSPLGLNHLHSTRGLLPTFQPGDGSPSPTPGANESVERALALNIWGLAEGSDLQTQGYIIIFTLYVATIVTFFIWHLWILCPEFISSGRNWTVMIPISLIKLLQI